MTNPGRSLLRRHRKALAAVYGAVAVENTFDLLPGRVFATVSYVFAYLTGFEDVPELTQQAANLRDIAQRLDDDAGNGCEQTCPEP